MFSGCQLVLEYWSALCVHLVTASAITTTHSGATCSHLLANQVNLYDTIRHYWSVQYAKKMLCCSVDVVGTVGYEDSKFDTWPTNSQSWTRVGGKNNKEQNEICENLCGKEWSFKMVGISFKCSWSASTNGWLWARRWGGGGGKHRFNADVINGWPQTLSTVTVPRKSDLTYQPRPGTRKHHHRPVSLTAMSWRSSSDFLLNSVHRSELVVLFSPLLFRQLNHSADMFRRRQAAWREDAQQHFRSRTEMAQSTRGRSAWLEAIPGQIRRVTGHFQANPQGYRAFYDRSAWLEAILW